MPSYTQVRDTLLALEAAYGPLSLIKRYPDVVWGDTLVVDPRAEQQVAIADLSQWIEFHFTALVPLATVAESLHALDEVEYVDAPYVFHLNVEPTDGLLDQQWYLETVNAEGAWDLSRGCVDEGKPVVIGLSDQFTLAPIGDPGDYIQPDLHDDPLLGGRRLGNAAVGDFYGGHGTSVAGFAGAITDNGVVISSGGRALVDAGTIVQLNGLHGVHTGGLASLLYLHNAVITDNAGVGVNASSFSAVFFDQAFPVDPGAITTVQRNGGGGLSANNSVIIQAGMWTNGVCNGFCNNRIQDHSPQGAPYDVRALKGSVIKAESDFWGDDRCGPHEPDRYEADLR